MKAIAKGVLISILVSVCVLIFANLVFFFPWYMTLVMETFNISQVAATNNYMPQTEYDDALDRLEGYPIFKERSDKITIRVINASLQSAIGLDDPTDYDQEQLNDETKPYRQRGETITVEVKAVYPFEMELWGHKISSTGLDIPVSFTLKTIGLKHYKDWDYYD